MADRGHWQRSRTLTATTNCSRQGGANHKYRPEALLTDETHRAGHVGLESALEGEEGEGGGRGALVPCCLLLIVDACDNARFPLLCTPYNVFALVAYHGSLCTSDRLLGGF